MELKLEFQAGQYWFDGADREGWFMRKAIAHAAAMQEPLGADEIRERLCGGQIVAIGHNWDARIRSLAALETQRATAAPRAPSTLRRCDCGHTIPAAAVLNASLGSACPECYDRMSD